MSQFRKFEVAPSRQEKNFTTPVVLNEEQHSLIVGGLVSLEDDLRLANVELDNFACSYEHAEANTATGREFMLSSLTRQGDLSALSLGFYGGYDNEDAIQLDYIPGFNQFKGAIRYSNNRYDIDVASAVKIINDNTDIDLSAYLDRAVTADDIKIITEALHARARKTPAAASTEVKHYIHFGLDDITTELIITNTNQHSKQITLDTHIATVGSGPRTVNAVDYRVNINSLGQLLPTVTHEITTNDPLIQEVPNYFDPETAYLVLSQGIEAMRPIPFSSKLL